MVEKNTSMGIGEALRHMREKEGISIAMAAMQTNLPSNVIEKLEKNQFNDIGAPVFVRGYLINYAKYLSMNVDEITKAFNNIETNKMHVKICHANIVSHSKTIKHNRWGSWLSLVIIVLIIVILLSQIINKDSWLLTQVKKAFTSSSTTEVQLTQDQNANPNNLVINIDGGNNDSLLNSPDIKSDGFTQTDQATSLSLTSNNEIGQSPTDTVLNSSNNNDIVGKSGNISESTAPSNAGVATIDNLVSDSITSGNFITDSSASDNRALKTIELIPDAENWIEIKDKSGSIVRSGIFHAEEIINLPVAGIPYHLNIGRPNNISLKINGIEEPIMKYKIGSSRRNFRVGLPNE